MCSTRAGPGAIGDPVGGLRRTSSGIAMLRATFLVVSNAGSGNVSEVLRSRGPAVVTSTPSNTIEPSVTRSRPAIARSRLDLPDPDGPTTTVDVPAGASIETSASARVVPRSTVTCSRDTCATSHMMPYRRRPSGSRFGENPIGYERLVSFLRSHVDDQTEHPDDDLPSRVDVVD
ncbi:MAG: hypothetical protein R2697_01345 [Ilumatobacteraceae bacterium]